MNKSSRFLCAFIAIILTACSAGTPTASPSDSQLPTQPAQESAESISSAPPNEDTPVVILKTGNPEFALTALFEKGETLMAMTKTDAAGEVVDVTGAIFIAPDGRSIAIYFENGLPVRAIAEGHVVEFYNFTDSTVDVAIVAPDGTVTTQSGIPFDAQKIYQVDKTTTNNLMGGGHLAALSLRSQDKDIDWMQFASTALGAFSCAATIASGGTLSVLFAVGCGFFIYTTYFQATEQEIPVLVEGGDNAVSAINCGSEIARKDVMAIPDCGKLVLDTAKSIQESSSQTYEKQKRVVEEIELNSSRSPLGDALSCSNLTPEECANLGEHKYHLVTTDIYASSGNPGKSCRGPWDEYRTITISFSDESLSPDGFWWLSLNGQAFPKTDVNTYIYSDQKDWEYTISFNRDGFVVIEETLFRGAKRANPSCRWEHTFTITP